MSEHPLDFLSATDEVLSLFDDAPRGKYFGVDLMRHGLQRQREDTLLRRFAANGVSAEALEVELRQGAELRGGAEVSLLASVLASLQEAVLAMAQSLRDRPTLHGPVTSEIQDAVRLKVAFAVPGSLRLGLTAAEPELQRSILEEDGDAPLLERSVDSLMGLLASSVANDREDVLQQLASFGPRVATHVAALSGALERGHARIAIAWRSEGRRRTVRLDRGDALRLHELLLQFETTDREMVVRGRLVGGSLVRRVFELELDDGSVMSGKTDETALGMLEELFGQECTAHIVATETSLPTGEVKEAYRLQRLSP
ncbi:MAG TPA: hypothetical protein DEV93_19720 [Chloroflexi bacterium]|jgi:hypothetical protein|nr:hypothetical protein [Chloroflexota bacterium]HCU13401.1 hypothetical protein [Gemmatimonadota bacterium]